MRYERFVIVLLVVALVIMDASVLTYLAYHEKSETAPLFHCRLLLALGFSQIALLTFWAAIPIQVAPFRIVYVVSGISVLSIAILLPAAQIQTKITQWRTDWWDSPEVHLPLWTIRACLQAFVLSLPLIGLRRRGLRIAQKESGISPPLSKRETALGWWQFSLGRLFAVMTITALVLGVLPFYFQFDSPPSNLRLWLLIFASCVGQAGIALGALWLALGRTRLLLRVVSLVCACGLAVGLHYPFVGKLATPGSAEYAQICVLQALLIIGPLLVFRVLGYRIGRAAAG